MPTSVNFGNTSKSIRRNLETNVRPDYCTIAATISNGCCLIPILYIPYMPFHNQRNLIHPLHAISCSMQFNSRTKNICTKNGTLKCNFLKTFFPLSICVYVKMFSILKKKMQFTFIPNQKI